MTIRRQFVEERSLEPLLVESSGAIRQGNSKTFNKIMWKITLQRSDFWASEGDGSVERTEPSPHTAGKTKDSAVMPCKRSLL